jgi:hypothetical protein
MFEHVYWVNSWKILQYLKELKKREKKDEPCNDSQEPAKADGAGVKKSVG